jgi:hypothetical protein
VRSRACGFAQLWEAPVERNVFERRWLETATRAVPGIAPRVLAHDDSGVFAMEYLDGATYPLWKAELRAGRADRRFAQTVGAQLARVHAATAGRDDVARQFATDAGFHAIRLEPYLLATARVHTDLAPVLKSLAERTARTRLALVHGDVSPKNILVGPAGPGVSRCRVRLVRRSGLRPRVLPQPPAAERRLGAGVAGRFSRLLRCARRGLLEGVTWESAGALQARAASLLPGLLLARVDGKSPVEYLQDEASKARVRRVARALLLSAPSRLAAIREQWQGS